MDRYIIIKKVAGSKHPEVTNNLIDFINNNSYDCTVTYSQTEKFYMIKITGGGVFRITKQRNPPDRIYEEYKVRIYYFDALFTPEFDDLDVPIFTLLDNESTEPIYLQTYNPTQVNIDITSGYRDWVPSQGRVAPEQLRCDSPVPASEDTRHLQDFVTPVYTPARRRFQNWWQNWS
jgi:hypothetical protein